MCVQQRKEQFMGLTTKAMGSHERDEMSQPLTASLDLLLVEDRPVDAQLLQAAFLEVRRRVIVNHALTAEEAIRILRERLKHKKSLPDIIVLDLNLPKQHGRTVLAEIHNHSRLKTIPVIVWTSSLDEKDVIRCSELEANSYILKPSSWDEFVETALYVTNFAETAAEIPPIWPQKRSTASLDRRPAVNDQYEHLRNTCERVHQMLTTTSGGFTRKWTPVILLTLATQRMLDGLERHHRRLSGTNHPYGELLTETPRLVPQFEKLRETVRALEKSGNQLAKQLESAARTRSDDFSHVYQELERLLVHVRKFLSSETDFVYEQFNDTPALD